MYIILNNYLQRIGTLSNHTINGTPFYNDVITQQIADDDQQMTLQSVPDTTNSYDPNGNTKNWGHTLDSIFVPYGYKDTDKIQEGNSLAYQDPNNGRWYIMRLTSVTDATDSSNNHYKQATGVNLCIWKLGKMVQPARTLYNANSNEAFGALFSGSGWYFDSTSETVGGSSDIQFDGTSSAQSILQQLCQIYGAEIDAYVMFPQSVKMGNHSYASDFHIALKRVVIKRHLGEDTGARIVYGRNATNIQRTVLDDNLYTRLYVYGPNGSTCACSVTDNEPYVQDDKANEMYNPSTNDGGNGYLEGAITSQTMSNPEQLAQWGWDQLKVLSHPRANYTVGVSNYLNSAYGGKEVTNANLGDTFRILDLKMQPQLTVEARVIRKQISFANPYQNNITLGEYVTVNVVTPQFISDLQQDEFNHVNELLDEIKNNPRALTCTIDKPDGCTWHKGEVQKRFIAHIYVLGQDITGLIQPKGYIWQLWQNGSINTDFAKAHEQDGQTLILKNDINISDIATDAANGIEARIDNSDNPDSNVFDLDSEVLGTNTVTGVIRLIIDTDYITDNQKVAFDTNYCHREFSIDNWTDSWGDPRVGALQYVNYNPNNNCYYASLVYYGRNRPREDNGNGKLIERASHTEIARLNSNGEYFDSMILLFSHHNSNFGLDYRSPGGPYIWTTIEDHTAKVKNHDNKYWIVRLPYMPNTIVHLDDLPKSDLLMQYSENGCFVNFDNSSGVVLFSHDDTSVDPSHTVDFYKSTDLLNLGNDSQPFQTIHLTDYGFDPKIEDYDFNNDVDNGDSTHNPEDDSTQQTFQSSCVHYPYYFFDSGNANMSDQRLVWCINISSGEKVFCIHVDLDKLNLTQPDSVIQSNFGNYTFAEPETLNWKVNDEGKLVFLYGLNVGYENSKTNGYDYNDEGIPQPDYKHYELLYEIGMDINSNQQNDTGNQNGKPQISGGE